MNTDNDEANSRVQEEAYLHQELTREILASAFRVHNALGCGLLEKVYGKAMVWDLRMNSKQVDEEKEFKVVYRGKEFPACAWACC